MQEGEIKMEYCECVYYEIDKIYFRKTEQKLPRYKCKKCNLHWKNPNHGGY